MTDRITIGKSILIALAGVALVGLWGCSASHWLGTEDVNDSITVTKGAFGASLKVQTRKDTAHKLDVDSVTWNRTDGVFELHGLHSDYNGRASDVITADAGRALAVGQAQLSQASYVDAVGRLIGQVGGAVKSGLLGYGEAKAMILNAGLSPLQGASGSFGPQGGSFQLGGPTSRPSMDTPPPGGAGPESPPAPPNGG